MSSSPLRITYLGFAVLGAAVLGAYLYDRAHHARPTDPAALAVAAPAPPTTASAAPVAPGAKPTTVPLERPTFELKDLQGQRVSISRWNGKALIINFWATWCAPCRREIPLLNKIQDEYGAKGVQVVGIAVDFPEDVQTFTKQVALHYPLMIGEEDGLEVAHAFGVQSMAFPFTAFTDRQGRMLAVHLGELHEAQARAILAIVAEVDGGTRTAAEARAAIQEALAKIPAKDAHPAG